VTGGRHPISGLEHFRGNPATYKIGVQARDGRHASEDSFDSSKNASFRPPGLQSATNPEKPEGRQFQSRGSGRSSFSGKAVALDSDGDPVLYKFQVNGKDMK